MDEWLSSIQVNAKTEIGMDKPLTRGPCVRNRERWKLDNKQKIENAFTRRKLEREDSDNPSHISFCSLISHGRRRAYLHSLSRLDFSDSPRLLCVPDAFSSRTGASLRLRR